MTSSIKYIFTTLVCEVHCLATAFEISGKINNDLIEDKKRSFLSFTTCHFHDNLARFTNILNIAKEVVVKNLITNGG